MPRLDEEQLPGHLPYGIEFSELRGEATFLFTISTKGRVEQPAVHFGPGISARRQDAVRDSLLSYALQLRYRPPRSECTAEIKLQFAGIAPEMIADALD